MTKSAGRAGLRRAAGLRDALGEAVGATISFDLELDDPNTEIEIGPPPDPRPASELPGG